MFSYNITHTAVITKLNNTGTSPCLNFPKLIERNKLEYLISVSKNTYINLFLPSTWPSAPRLNYHSLPSIWYTTWHSWLTRGCARHAWYNGRHHVSLTPCQVHTFEFIGPDAISFKKIRCFFVTNAKIRFCFYFYFEVTRCLFHISHL